MGGLPDSLRKTGRAPSCHWKQTEPSHGAYIAEGFFVGFPFIDLLQGTRLRSIEINSVKWCLLVLRHKHSGIITPTYTKSQRTHTHNFMELPTAATTQTQPALVLSDIKKNIGANRIKHLRSKTKSSSSPAFHKQHGAGALIFGARPATQQRGHIYISEAGWIGPSEARRLSGRRPPWLQIDMQALELCN